ncbi:MAG: hypothetical protein JWN28_608 [Candidatus Saccharibacteria bacterium]|nr:hypothetical protein [Candidatus Saccharibacteria bacterium]
MLFGFDPISWLLGFYVKALVVTMNSIMQLVEVALLHRPTMTDFPMFDDLGGQAVGSAIPISRLVLYFVLAFAIFLPKARGRIIPAIVFAVIISIATPYWYRIIGGMLEWSKDLTKMMLSIFGDSAVGSSEQILNGAGQIFKFNFAPLAAVDLILGSVTLMNAVASGMVVLAISFGYAVLTQILAFVGLFVAALLGFGGRVDKLFQAIVSISLVAILFGVPVMTLIIEVGKAFSQSEGWGVATGGSAFAQGFVLNAALFIAALSQVVLTFLFYKATQTVMGKLNTFISGGNISARMMGRDLNPNMTQQQSVNRAMTEPERGLQRERPGLLGEGKNIARGVARDKVRQGLTKPRPSPQAISGPVSTSTAPGVPSGAASSSTSPLAAGTAAGSETTRILVGEGAASAGTTGASAIGAAETGVAVSTAGAAVGGAAASGAAAGTTAAATTATTAATVGTAAAAGAPTGGVGAAVVLGTVAAKHGIDTAKEVKRSADAERPTSKGS